MPDAGPAATLDLVQQTGARAIGKDRILAGPQPEHLLQQMDAVADGPCRRVRTEIVGPAIRVATKEAKPGEFVAGEDNVGIGLVVAKQDVVAGDSDLIRLFSRSSASASVRVAVVSTAAIWLTICAMRGLGRFSRKYDETRLFRFFALPT